MSFYSKTLLGCKENWRYEMGVQKIVFRGRRHLSRIDDFYGDLTEIASKLSE